VKYTILHYCFTHASLISRPHQSDPVYTVSLDTARDDEQPLSQRLAEQKCSPDVKHPDYNFLYQALEQLPPQYREVLSCHFGLYGRPTESLYTLSKRMSANVKGTIAYLMMYRALSRMRTMLMKGGTLSPEGMGHRMQQALWLAGDTQKPERLPTNGRTREIIVTHRLLPCQLEKRKASS
jgi:hypothetical protein